MNRSILILVVGAFALHFAASLSLRGRKVCDVDAVAKDSVSVTIRSKRNATGKWLTRFSALGDAQDLREGLLLDLKQTVTECDGREVVLIQGQLGIDAPAKEKEVEHQGLLGKDTPVEENEVQHEGLLGKDAAAKENGMTIAFSKKAGENVIFFNNGRTAARRAPSNTYNEAIVLTNRPLKDDELFEVRLEEIDNTWAGTISVAVTSYTPENMVFHSYFGDYSSGLWYYSEDGVYGNGSTSIDTYGVSNRKFKIGDRVGVMKKGNGDLHFFLNGVDQGVAEKNLVGTFHGFVDIYGQGSQVTIVNPP